MRIEALMPIRVRRSGTELRLLPGVPVDLPDDEASKLLQRAPNKVRVVVDTSVTIESAMKPDGRPLSEIYWEIGDGRIVGPAIPEFLAKSGDQFWIVTTFETQTRWINANLLRSRKDFAKQRPAQEVELARSWGA